VEQVALNRHVSKATAKQLTRRTAANSFMLLQAKKVKRKVQGYRDKRILCDKLGEIQERRLNFC
jgi:hypothetical protein